MKSIFSLLILINLLNADSMYSNGQCVKYFDTADNDLLYLEYSNGNTDTVRFNLPNVDFLISNMNKFELVNGQCTMIGTKLGMSAENYNFTMSLLGGLYGIAVLFLLGATL